MIRVTLHAIGGDNVVKSFRSGCFRHFLDYKGGDVQKKLRFGPNEYNLVSGFRFSTSTFDPNIAHVVPSRAIHYRLFQGQRTTVREMKERFTQMMMAIDTPDYVKVANILFAYQMILYLDQNRYVDPWMWALVEDVERWNSFPWGHIFTRC
ncbi:hypothetical protein C2S51_021340 [Perilla frutescens var. frutescens]|nr:hypothetical protein C2S51_021340 [Perilla frutescens var. frutescens]